MSSEGRENYSLAPHCFSFIPQQGCTNGCAELTVLGDYEPYAIDFLHCREHHLALRQKRKVADKHEIAYATPQRTQYGGRANGLQHHPNKPQGYVFARSIGLGIGKE